MTRTKPPLADISIGGRKFRTEQKAFERFGADLARELEIEIGKLSDDGARTGLDQAGERLQQAIAQQIQMAAAIPDRMQGAKVLRAGLDLMFASADTASRIDHKRVPRIIRKASTVPARNSKKNDDDIDRDRLRTAIEDEVKEKQLSVSLGEKFARQIAPGVRSRLGLSPTGSDWPQWSTIKTHLRAIRQDKTDSSNLRA